MINEKFTWISPFNNLLTVTGYSIKICGKFKLHTTYADATYHSMAFAAGISDSCILGMDFLQEKYLKLNVENNEFHSSSV